MSGYADHPFPHPSHLRGVWSIECPGAALILQEAFQLRVATVDLKLIHCSNKIRPSV